MRATYGLLDDLRLHTVCQSARCPNIGRCFARRTATFLILGDVCTRDCTFCAVSHGTPASVDENEPQRIFEAVERLGLGYAVITSVTRDDLADGGAAQFAMVVRLLHRRGVNVEVLIPDFLGSAAALSKVVAARPEVIGHNIETVPRLYARVRPAADYRRSLAVIRAAKRRGVITKSGLMLGLGENRDEVIGVMSDLRAAGCDLLTIGQYLQPSSRHHPVVRFVPPEEFSEYQHIGQDMGFGGVASAPLVRSSFEAAALYAGAGLTKDLSEANILITQE